MKYVAPFAAVVVLAGTAGAAGIAAAAPAAAGSEVLRPGDSGMEVKRLQRALDRLGFDPGPVNGRFGHETTTALWAFQKSRGLPTRAAADEYVWRAIDRRRAPQAMVPGGAADRVEINLGRQLLTVYRAHRPVLISHVSTGAEVHYCHNGRCGDAVTPVGDYRVTSKSPGWTTGPLGSMYNSLYFNGGIAMHGSTKVPPRPASHGCVRLPMHVADRLYRMVGVGEPVYVREGREVWNREYERYDRRGGHAGHGRHGRMRGR
ncbi:murein L,D-transpeptidase [Spongiactinospora gelatinilytica]|uniref:Murein L,D-transpeptidase n=1 Tax=Spongiactinospora gelatinilytica TaxID=2666298 RepID=A0A2W2EXW6_9ACTN|nr:L,D-transpeptidase family protein [Spongiactinospora gelatinilytica]PZG29466.1 murein L,D-transpeptidase [Spongiactinospora gelatinilytica]